MAKDEYDSSSDDPQVHLDQAAHHLTEATRLNDASMEVIKSGTGNNQAATTYRQAAGEHLKLAKECRTKAAELRASSGLKAAFPASAPAEKE